MPADDARARVPIREYQVRYILTQGRERITLPDSWLRETHWDYDGRVSVIGAVTLNTNLMSIPAQERAIDALYRALPWEWRLRGWWLVRLFDHTRAEIVFGYNRQIYRRQSEDHRAVRSRVACTVFG